MQEITNKRFFRNYAFFVLILVVIFAILTYSVIISKKSWSNNLANSVQKVLNEYENDRWTVEDNISINSPISANCAAYNIKDKKNNSNAKAIIIRVTTFYGPLPAVFIYEQKDDITFAGWSSLHGRIRRESLSSRSNKRLEYWKSKLPEILE